MPLGVSIDIRGAEPSSLMLLTFPLSCTRCLAWEKWSERTSRFSLDRQKQAPGALYVTSGAVSWFLCMVMLNGCSSPVTVMCVGLFPLSPAVGCLPNACGSNSWHQIPVLQQWHCLHKEPQKGNEMQRPCDAVVLLQPVLINYHVMGDEVEELALVRGVLSSNQLLSFGSAL